MGKMYFLALIMLACASSVLSQVPTNQDCMGAIPVCQNVYNQNNSFSGTGNYPGEIPDYAGALSDNNCPNNCLLDGELNDVWYIFTVQSSGNLNFTITPNSSSDDYDWALYNLTNANCSNILTNNSSVQASCNFCGSGGATGIATGYSGNCNYGDPIACSNFNGPLPVTAGQTYVLNVSNFSSSQSGYVLDFGASTASIFDNIPPIFQSVTPPACGATTLSFNFSENVLCNTVTTGDFTLTGPGGPYTISAISGGACTSGAPMENTFTITFSPAITQSGAYSICLVNTAGSVADNCGNLAAPACFNFNVTAVTATTTQVNSNCGANGSATVNPSGGTGSYTYAWNTVPAQNTQTATGLPAGNYIVTVTSGACTATNSVTISNTGSVTVPTSVVNSNCGSNGSATANPSGGTGSYTYAWGTVPAQNTQTASGLPAGTYTVTVTSGSCSQTASASVIDNGSISLSSSAIDDNCNSGTGSATVTASGGTGTYVYLWNTVPSQNTATANGLTSGSYTVTVTSGSCTATITVQVNNTGGPSISTTATDASCGLNNGSVCVTANGGSGTYTYQWNTVPVQTTSCINGLAPGSYSVTVSDGGPCPVTSSVSIADQPGPILSLVSSTPEDVGMGNGSATVNASGGTAPLIYIWNTSPTQTGPSASGLSNGNYQVVVTDDNGCTDTLDVTIPLIGGATLSVSAVGAHCNQSDGSATVLVTNSIGNVSYLWNTNPPQTNATANNLAPGNYSVTVTDGLGSYTTTVTVPNIAGPNAGFSANPNPAQMGTDVVNFHDQSIGASSWLWTFGDGSGSGDQNPSHIYPSEGEYTVWQYVYDIYGCSDSASVLMVINDVFTIFIPNAFSPNGDGVNDYFRPSGNNLSSDGYSLEIFDRWGQMIFRSTSIDHAWDGKISGKPDGEVLIDTYTYSITVFDNLGLQHDYLGKVTILY